MRSYIDGLTDCLRVLGQLSEGTSVSSSAVRTAVEHLGNKGYARWKTVNDLADRADDMSQADIDSIYVRPPVWNGNTLTITETGNNLYFFEFGTGVKQNYRTEYGGQYGFYPTSWSGGPNGKGWLVGEKRRIYKGKWMLPWSVSPQSTRGLSLSYKKAWVTKSGEVHSKRYQRRVWAYWATGHRPVNGMYHAMKTMCSKDAMQAFAAEVFKK